MMRDLPKEILSQIFYGTSNSHLVITLWKCGDSNLNKKLASAITFLDLEDTRLVSTSRYPKLLSELTNLRYLRISRGSHPLMDSSRSLSKEIQKIHGSNLETLKFSSFEASHAFRRHSDTDDEFGDPIFIETMYEQGSSPLYMSHIFPRLTTLEIACAPWDEDYYPSGSAIEAYDLPGLPPTLTRLSVPYLYLHELYDAAVDWQLAKGALKMDTSSLVRLASSPTGTRPCFAYFAALPRSLLVLDTKLVIQERSLSKRTKHKLTVDASFFADAPPGLHTLTEIDTNYVPIDYSWLPRSLAHCNFGYSPPAASPASFAQCPPALAELMIPHEGVLSDYSADASRWATIWPKQLEKLIVFANHSSDLLRSLPYTLTYFETSAYDLQWSELEKDLKALGSKFWPRTLSTLILTPKVPEFVLESLPPQITKLHIDWDVNTPFPSSKLPRGLLDLGLHLRDFEMDDAANPFLIEPDLPQSLVSLYLEGIGMLNLNCGALVLPSSLESFILAPSHNDDSPRVWDRITLPQGLKVLAIQFWDSSDLLPPSLTHLTINSLFTPTDAKGFCSDWSAAMPSSLESLWIHSIVTNATKVPSTCFASLKNLNRLVIISRGLFEGHHLKNLSSKLRHISLSVSNFTDECVPYINQCWLVTTLRLDQESDMIRLSRVWPPESRADDHSEFQEFADIADRRYNGARNKAFCYPDERVVASMKNGEGKKKTKAKK